MAVRLWLAAYRRRVLTGAEVAKLLKLNQQTVRNWIDAGQLPALRVGRRIRVRSSELDAFAEQGRTARPPAGSADDLLKDLEALAEKADDDLQRDLRALVERHRPGPD